MRLLCLTHCTLLVRAMMQMMSTFVNNTFTMSYLGCVGFGNLEPYIDGIQIYTSGDRGMTIEMLSVDGRMVADLK